MSSMPNKMNSIEKALAVMRVLSSPDGPHRLADIARHLQLNSPSVHRILQTLVANNYAVATGDGSYAAGLAMRALGAERSDDLVSEAILILEDLQRATGHTVHFAAFTGSSAVYVAKVESAKPYQMASRVGMPIKLHRTSIGKSILAALPQEEAQELLLAELDMKAENFAGLDAFHRDLDEVRARGFAIDDEENEPNVRCAGAVVRDAKGRPIGGISISEITYVLGLARLVELGTPVVDAANLISARAGFVSSAKTGS